MGTLILYPADEKYTRVETGRFAAGRRAVRKAGAGFGWSKNRKIA